MTIDERLDALTMNLELAARDIEGMLAESERQRDNIAELAASLGTLSSAVGALTIETEAQQKNTGKLFQMMETVLDTMNTLARTVTLHERRLGELEA